MTTKRPISSGTALAGVHHIAKVTAACNCIFHQTDQQNDVGNDAFIEFVVDEAATGCCIAAQIKSGQSYTRNGRFLLSVDEKHFEYWRSHSLPFCGFVYDPVSDTARWIDITACLADKEANPTQFTIELPNENIYDSAHFETFRDHFLSYRPQFSGAAKFGGSLVDFSHLEDLARCESGIRALFSFHRNRLETWYYVISTLANFRNHPLLPILAVTLCHVPGHMDIFWRPGQNTIPEPVSTKAESLLKTMLSRDLVLTLLGAIDDGGFERGSIGRFVDAVVALAPNRRRSLESIVLDADVPEHTRYWALLLLILYEQHRQRDYCITIAENAAARFDDDDNKERIRGLIEVLKTPGRFV